MLSKSWILLAAFYSFSTLATVSYDEKVRQVELIQDLQETIPSINISAYQRELLYEKSDLPVEVRAKRETNLLAERIKTQINLIYLNALEEHQTPELAAEVVREQIERDIDKVAPEFQEDIRRISLNALEGSMRGETSSEVEAATIEADMKKSSESRSLYLNSGFTLQAPEQEHLKAKPETVTAADTKEYKSKKDLLTSLVSTKDSYLGGASSNMSMSSSKSFSAGGSVSYRVSVSFLGSTIDAGPYISFNRTYSTSASMSGEGLKPLMTRDGKFDFYLRDTNGKVVMKDGKEARRKISFSCYASLSFENNNSGSGGFKIMGMGADARVSKSFSDSVSTSSRQVALPEYIEGKTATLSVLAQLCHKDFVNTKLMNTMTVKDSLNLMMKDIISSLVYTNPDTKCLTDKHCANWFKKQIQPVAGKTAVPRCMEESRQKFMACVARGVNGSKCPITLKGKLLSDGVSEYPCDKGLVCKQTKEYGWFKNFEVFQYAEGKCSPK
jgi:hypothetical protein